jgi:ubiquinone/menaquinone biosynthesis C-methylase UbiE
LSGKILPLQGSEPYAVALQPDPAAVSLAPDGLPLPPKDLWAGYGDTPEEHISSGQRDMGTMLRLLEEAGATPLSWKRVLDFGCASGRMLRHFPRSGAVTELWGVDFNAWYLTWCKLNFSPPFRFAVTTTAPHLPFEDNSFDLVYCGSVFTHISDLADTWLLELRRVIRSGGYAYITVHDQTTIELLRTKYKDKTSRALLDMVQRCDAQTGVLSHNYASFAIDAGTLDVVQTFYDINYLERKWSSLMKVVSITPESYGYQTAMVLQKQEGTERTAPGAEPEHSRRLHYVGPRGGD